MELIEVPSDELGLPLLHEIIPHEHLLHPHVMHGLTQLGTGTHSLLLIQIIELELIDLLNLIEDPFLWPFLSEHIDIEQ